MRKQSITIHELAAKLPGKGGKRKGRSLKTVKLMVRRGELPAFDFQFVNGARGWSGESLKHPNIAPFLEQDETRAA